jgi:NAD-dependent SIR2 family protein deacetylase
MGQKTVFILGAGFSFEAGAPTQNQLVKKIFEINRNNSSVKKELDFFKKFLTDTLNIPEVFHDRVSLEDVFTPIDRCAFDNISFRNVDRKQLIQISEVTNFLIGETLNKILIGPPANYINVFARYLVSLSSARQNFNYRKYDPVSVISTNWDILLDNAIKQEIDNNYHKRGVVDYCCYISSYRKNDESIKPGLEMLGLGGFNVKLLKVHGSLNWLQCPKCLRLYVEFFSKIATLRKEKRKKCIHCTENFGNLSAHILETNMIMPSFLKDLSNPQYKIIWQNAGIEISEAKKIVFIGYSLPQADFEMRQLLARMTRNNAEIHIVDFLSDTNGKYLNEQEERFRTFFGGRKINFYYDGAKKFVEDELPQLK